jgi:hypothetical protein
MKYNATSFMIVQETDVTKFVRHVNVSLKEGWVLHGTMSVVPMKSNSEPFLYVQALTYE